MGRVYNNQEIVSRLVTTKQLPAFPAFPYCLFEH